MRALPRSDQLVWVDLAGAGMASSRASPDPSGGAFLAHLSRSQRVGPTGMVGVASLANAEAGIADWTNQVEIGCKIVRELAGIDTRVQEG